MSPTGGDAKPWPKAASTKPGRPRRYRRHTASPKQWQILRETKLGPCRCCLTPGGNGHSRSPIQLHHIVSRQDGGDDYAANLVPLCEFHHGEITRRHGGYEYRLLESLDDSEYAYMVERGGEGYPERAYGIEYTR